MATCALNAELNLLILLIVILVLCRKGTKNFSFCNLCGCLKFREYYNVSGYDVNIRILDSTYFIANHGRINIHDSLWFWDWSNPLDPYIPIIECDSVIISCADCDWTLIHKFDNGEFIPAWHNFLHTNSYWVYYDTTTYTRYSTYCLTENDIFYE